MRMEDNSVAVQEGNHIGKTSYNRRAQKWKELNLQSVKIDHYDPTQKLIREVKKSPKLEHAHMAQVKYYIYALEQRGITGASGIIEYPKHRKTTMVELSDIDRIKIENWMEKIRSITSLQDCPSAVKKGYCRNCAFFDFCFV